MRYGQDKVSKALFTSSDKSIVSKERLWAICCNWMSLLIASPACLVGTEPTWSFLIKRGRNKFNRLARIFVRIFMSTLIKDMGRKLAHEVWSRSGLGNITILAVRRSDKKLWPFLTELYMAVKGAAITSTSFL